MPVRDIICPSCHAAAGAADIYCSFCGSVLASNDSLASDRSASPRPAHAPLATARPMPPPDLQPLHIVPDVWRQRRRTMKRVIALLLTAVLAAVFALTLVLSGDRQDDLAARGILIASGLLTAIAVGAWVRFAIRHARKRARRQRWQMSAF